MIWVKIIWVIIGIIAWLFTYHSYRKRWYIEHNEYWKNNHKLILIIVCVLFPYWLFGGLLSLIYWMILIDRQYWSFYFNIKRYERKQLLKEFRNENKPG
jgi:Na+/melibiose symporter-like transporter